MSRRSKVRRHRNRCWMCKMEKLMGKPTRHEKKAELAEKEWKKEEW